MSINYGIGKKPSSGSGGKTPKPTPTTKRFIGEKGNPDFQNGWVNHSTAYKHASFVKTNDGIVYLSGVIKGGATNINKTIFVLPIGYRPSKTNIFATLSNEKICRIDIHPNGAVVVKKGVSKKWLTLCGISFKVADNG